MQGWEEIKALVVTDAKEAMASVYFCTDYDYTDYTMQIMDFKRVERIHAE